ncbi:Murein hydrolase activator EnvC [Altererythrobacter insulae]|nr:Murein hydrolase activator EnvC [Altererythrobacter insulae]
MVKVTSRLPIFLMTGIGLAGLGWAAVSAQSGFTAAAVSVSGFADLDEARDELKRAQAVAGFAEQRAEKFAQEAAAATEAIDRLDRESAAVAAQIQQSEAEILAAGAQLALIGAQRRRLDARLAERQQPLVRLTGALQNMARRPALLSALQPGTLKETVYVRAVLETTLPTIRAQTAGLRSEVARGRSLERQAAQALADLRGSENALQLRRNELAALSAQQQQASLSNRAMARREAQRALALAEDARSLDDLVSEFDRAGIVRSELALLPGPIIRPERPDASRVMANSAIQPQARATSAPADYQLPVRGRTLVGFGEVDAAGIASKGVTIAPTNAAQIIAPASGRISFAGAYRGFGRIVIIEHENGWTSIITGLAQTMARTGDRVIGGAPIGQAGESQPEISFELRNQGEPTNPLILL